MLHAGGVDETLFIQILHAYSARNPLELVLDDAYDACLARMGGDAAVPAEEGQVAQNGTELQLRFGAKLFVREREGGERILVAGTKKRNLELIPLRRVFSTLQELARTYHQNATQLKQAVKAKVVGIPEEIVQEYCDMAISTFAGDEHQSLREKEDFKKCSTCGVMKSYKSFTKHKDKPLGLRSRCKACESKARQDKKEMLGEEAVAVSERAAHLNSPPSGSKKKKKKDSHVGLTGTAICAACGDRKPVYEFDKARQKPFTLKCRTCTELDAPLMSKLCCSCLLELPLDRFYRDSYTKAGFRPRCMECMKARKGVGVEVLPPMEPEMEGTSADPDLDDSAGVFPPTSTTKRPRSRRSRRKSQKNREADLVAFDEDIREVVESKRRGRQRERKTKRNGRHVETEEGSDVVETPVKLGALSSLVATPTEEKPNLASLAKGSVGSKVGRPKGLTGCSTVKDKQGNVTKYCTGCLHFKKATEFGRDVSKPSGLRSRCRQCQKRGRDGTPSVVAEEKTSGDVARKKIPRKPVRKKAVIAEKICSRCGHQKPVGEFYRDKSKEDSYASICKRCAKEAKNRAEKSAEKRTPGGQGKKGQGQGQDLDDADMELVMNYVDALLPESSACSADPGDEGEAELEDAAIPVEHRVCIGCHIDKSWIEFEVNPLLPGGLCPLCKDCRRGNGMAGRRLKGQNLKRCCLRCGRSRSAHHFAKSIFYPNRTSRICQICREEDEMNLIPFEGTPVSKRRRLDSRQQVLDLIDFENDALRVQDPGGGEKLWNQSCADSDTEEEIAPSRRRLPHRRFVSEGVLNTQLKLDGPKSVTITHHVASGCDLTAGQKREGSFVWNGYHLKNGKMTYLMHKQCKRCGEVKSRESFFLDPQQPSNLSPHCTDCSAEIAETAAQL